MNDRELLQAYRVTVRDREACTRTLRPDSSEHEYERAFQLETDYLELSAAVLNRRLRMSEEP